MTAAAVTVRRARVGPSWASAPGREVLQRWLCDIDLTRHGLPAQAIVIVRRVQAPAVALHAGQPTTPRHLEPLARALRGALRPAAAGAVGAGVTAVWFADDAELLACLARDALGRALPSRWWWPLLFGRAPSSALALQRWAAAAPAVPWALSALEKTGQGADWLEHIGPAGCLALVQALARTYPLCAAVADGVLGAAAATRVGAVSGAGPVGAAGTASTASGGPLADDRSAVPLQADLRSEGRAPGSALAGQTRSAGAAEGHALLRLAEVLRVAPHRAADPAWVAELLAPRFAAPALASSSSAVAATGAEGDAWGDLARRRAGRDGSSGAPAARRRSARRCAAGGAADRVTQASTAGALASGDEPFLAPGGQTPSDGPPADPAAPGRTAQTPLRRAGPRAAAQQAPPPWPGASFDTRFGGIVFLLNVALQLGLYGDFTQPQQPGLPLSPWLLLHAALTRAMGRDGALDPLAAWLQQRGGAMPEAHLQDPPLPGPWQLPATALRAFDADLRPWHALVGADRLQLWHPAGFCIAQRPADVGLQALLDGLQRPRQSVVTHAVSPRWPAPRLSTLVWPVLRARLALALGLPPRAAVALALALPARVQASAERTDLHFSLAALPLAVRLAGLDRDPGWLPAAGSDIRFHFD